MFSKAEFYYSTKQINSEFSKMIQWKLHFTSTAANEALIASLGKGL